MLQTRRCALKLLQRPYVYHCRTYANSSSSESHHSESNAHHEHPQPANESIGRGFYLAIGGIALSLAVYKYTVSSSADPAFGGDAKDLPVISRWIRYFNELGKKDSEINDLHVAVLQQASHDRNLFENEQPTKAVDLRFPEVFQHSGSPFNVPAGHQANLDALREFYRKKDKKIEEEWQIKRDRDAKSDEKNDRTSKKEISGTLGRR